MWVRWLPAFACPWCRWSGLLSDALPSCRVPCLLPSFLLCLCCITLEYGSISRFKGVFRGFYGVDVCLYGFGALRGLCGFRACVELGGYMTCGVFALRFLLFSSCPLFSSFRPALVLLPCLASVLGLVLSIFVGCCFFFPYGCMRKKKGRSVLVRPLLSCCGCVGCYPITTIFPASTLYSIPATL